MNAQSEPSQRGGVRPGAGRPAGSRSVRAVMREKLIADCTAKLGGNVGPLVLADIERVVDLIELTRMARADLLAGRAKLADVVKLEGTLGRALKRLGLPDPNAAVPTDDAWRKFLASHQHADGDG
jgi:hypothetical protein